MGSRKVNTEDIDEELLIASIGTHGLHRNPLPLRPKKVQAERNRRRQRRKRQEKAADGNGRRRTI